MKRIKIKFIHPYSPYSAGEIATFYEREATRLIDRGFAVYEGGDEKRESQADKLKALRGVRTQAVTSAPENQAIQGPSNAPKSPQTGESTRNEQSIENKAQTATATKQGGKNKGSGGRSNARTNKKR